MKNLEYTNLYIIIKKQRLIDEIEGIQVKGPSYQLN